MFTTKKRKKLNISRTKTVPKRNTISVESSKIKVNFTKQKHDPNQEIKLAPRCEQVIEIDIPKNKDVICLSEEIAPGNFLLNSNVGKANITIVNSNEKEVKLYNYQPKLENLENFDLVKSNTNNSHASRFEKIKSLIKIADHSNQEEEQSILTICKNFQDIFHLDGEKLTYTNITQHKIPLIERQLSNPINIRPYRLAESHKNEISKQVDEMLKNDVVEHSKSPWNSPLLIVPKKSENENTKKWRVVVDYRKINNITKGDAFPLPKISDILDQTSNSHYFSTIDLASGYHQVLMDPDDREKTAFSTPTGHYHFKRMPFGLKSAPATFQRAMNRILPGLQGIKCLVYLADIIIFGRNLLDHNSKLTDVFKCLREYNLKSIYCFY